jgi:pimeloyl-ACP methyl ester carboxylesterase
MSVATSSFPSPVDPPFERVGMASASDGTRLFFRGVTKANSNQSGEAGTLPHVFLCDGIGCDGFVWKHLSHKFAESFNVTHWHYRGHGRSAPPKDAERITVADHADDLQAIRLAEGNPKRAILVGHSMGVQVALETYRRHPDNIAALVLLCGSYGRVTQTVRGMPILEYVLPSLMRVVEKHPDVVRAIWSRVPHEMALRVALKMGDLDPENVKMEDVLPYMQHMSLVDIGMFLRMLGKLGEHTAEDMLETIQVPTLVVASERDTFTPAWLSSGMAKAIPHSTYDLIPGGSHAAPVEQPERVWSAIAEFLQARV